MSTQELLYLESYLKLMGLGLSENVPMVNINKCALNRALTFWESSIINVACNVLSKCFMAGNKEDMKL